MTKMLKKQQHDITKII